MFAIAAVSENWGIGKDNQLLFHISADMKRFRQLTLGKTVLMGRKTLQSMPGGKGLPDRRNIVLTGSTAFTAPDAEIVNTPVQAVFTAGEDAEDRRRLGVARLNLAGHLEARIGEKAHFRRVGRHPLHAAHQPAWTRHRRALAHARA